jgi:hypothetical protein
MCLNSLSGAFSAYTECAKCPSLVSSWLIQNVHSVCVWCVWCVCGVCDVCVVCVCVCGVCVCVVCVMCVWCVCVCVCGVCVWCVCGVWVCVCGVCVCVCGVCLCDYSHSARNTQYGSLYNKNPLVLHRDTTQQLINALECRGYYTCPPGLTFSNSAFCPKRCIYVNCTDLRTNSDYFPIQRQLTGLLNRDGVCLLRGTDWVFIYNSN